MTKNFGGHIKEIFRILSLFELSFVLEKLDLDTLIYNLLNINIKLADKIFRGYIIRRI